MFLKVRNWLFARTILDSFGRFHCMQGEGLPVALQNRFVSKDSLIVRFLVEETIWGGSVQDNKNVIINDSKHLAIV